MAAQNSDKYKVADEKQIRKLFHVFDLVQSMVYKSLVTKSYPKFVTSDIGMEVRRVLEMREESASGDYE